MRQIVQLLLICCFLHISNKLIADNKGDYYQSSVRPITFKTKDSTINAYVKISTQDLESISDKVFYYWEKNGTIHKNQGSFSGNVLHGKYNVLNRNDLMISEGHFNNGTKDGIWRRWDNKGKLLQIDFWKKGVHKKTAYYFNGRLYQEIVYSENGEPKKKWEYTPNKKKKYVQQNNIWVEKRWLFFKKREQQIDSLSTTAISDEKGTLILEN